MLAFNLLILKICKFLACVVARISLVSKKRGHEFSIILYMVITPFLVTTTVDIVVTVVVTAYFVTN